MGRRPRSGHEAAKAKAAPHRHAAAKAKAAPMGKQPRPRHANVNTSKATIAPMGKQLKPRHATKAMACLHGHTGMPLGIGSKAPRGT